MARYDGKACGTIKKDGNVCGKKLAKKKGTCPACKTKPTKVIDWEEPAATPLETLKQITLANATQEQLQEYLTDNKDFRDIKFCPKCNPRPQRNIQDTKYPYKSERGLNGMDKAEIREYLRHKYNKKFIENEGDLKRVDFKFMAMQLNRQLNPDMEQ